MAIGTNRNDSQSSQAVQVKAEQDQNSNKLNQKVLSTSRVQFALKVGHNCHIHVLLKLCNCEEILVPPIICFAVEE